MTYRFSNTPVSTQAAFVHVEPLKERRATMNSASEMITELRSIETQLNKLSRNLEQQFSERFDLSGVVNPMSILKRVQKLQGELPALRSRAEKVIERKQELIDNANDKLCVNRKRLQELSARTGYQQQDDTEMFGAFTQAMVEWDTQVTKASRADQSGITRDELNRLLAQCMLSR